MNAVPTKLTLKEKMMQAGWLSQKQRQHFIIFSVFSALLGCLFSYLVASEKIELLIQFGFVDYISSVAPLFLGCYLPFFIYRHTKQKYQKQLKKEFIDVVTILLILLQSGLTINQALKELALFLSGYRYAFAQQIKLTLFELNQMPNRDSAWNQLSRRCDLPEISFLVNFLKNENTYDRTFLDTLERTRDFIQQSRFAQVEEKTKRISVILVIPLGLFLLPSLVLILMGPVIVSGLKHIF